jgi:uncharacterized protein (TIGR03083 family)
MSEWQFMDPASRSNLVAAWDREAAGMMALAGEADWNAPTRAGDWEVRDVFGHLVDTTEGYFASFDAARGRGEPPENLGVRHMAGYIDEGARSLRGKSKEEVIDRLGSDLARFRGIVDGLTDEEWAGLVVPHKYMGPLPAAFYPLFQLVDYGVHSWDIREGSGIGHGLDGDSADLLVPLAFIMWQSTNEIPTDEEPYQLGIRVAGGHNAGDFVLSVGPSGIGVEPGDVSNLTTLEFDPASLVLTSYGRMNAGTVRGDRAAGERFLNSFFRV